MENYPVVIIESLETPESSEICRNKLFQPDDRFHLRIEASPCQFLVYDRNADGEITGEEVRDVFPDENLAENLFRDLDSTTGTTQSGIFAAHLEMNQP